MNITTALLEITTACNLRCKHCYLNRKVKNLNTELWFKIMDILEEIGIKKVVLLGGEPTLREDFYEILQYAILKFRNVSVETNGTTETKLENYKCSVVVSIEYPDKEKNDFIRGEGTFDLATKKLRFFKTKKNDTWLRYTIYADTDAEKMILLAESLGANSIGVPLKLVGEGSKLKTKIPPAEKLRKLFFVVAKLNEKFSHVHIVDTPEYYVYHPVLRERYKKRWINSSRSCPAGMTRIFINSQGDVFPCPFLQQLNMGNLLNEKVDNIFRRIGIWNEEVKKIEKSTKCFNCTYAAVCNGGCIANYIDYGKKIGLYCPIGGLNGFG